MPERRVRELGDPVLLTPSTEIVAGSPELRSIAADLADTLAAFRLRSGFGRGIAAPQIGVSKRVIFVRMQPTGFAGVLANPRVTSASRERFELWDDCFSLPNLMVRVSRAEHVRVEYEDENGQPRILSADGALSELLQHEIDHLDGVLALARATGPNPLATRAEWLRQQS
jgi:peptide deformylase